jgi:hypothetical protein
MRRRSLWILGAVAVLAPAIFLTLDVTRPRTPFGFLQGLEAGEPPEYELHVDHGLRRRSGSSSYYTVKGSYESVVAKARIELVKKGFQEAGGRPTEAFFQRTNPAVITARPQQVIIRSGWRYRPGVIYAGKEVLMGHKAPGWVTVFVYGVSPPSPWEALTELFGF